MSIGAPSSLGTLLIQRLDAVLGTTLGQQANLVSGARPSAVTQPGNPENPGALQNPGHRHPREAVDQAGAQNQGRATIGKTAESAPSAALPGRPATYSGTTQSAPTTLGYAARIILALLAKYPDASQTVRGQSPLIHQPAQAGALSARFAQGLTQTLQGSGIFYESHLAALAFGKASPQSLAREPQAQLGRQTPALPAQNTSPSPPAGPGIQVLPGGDGGPGATATGHTAQAGTQPAGAQPAGTPANPIPGLDPQAQFLVRQQLEVLANQSFIWQGQAWPGADMHWEVHRHTQDEESQGGIQGEHWSTTLRLSLPSLGEVQARLSLAGDQLVLRLTAPESARQLDRNIEALRARLLAHGLRASQLSVASHNEDATLSTRMDPYEPRPT